MKIILKLAVLSVLIFSIVACNNNDSGSFAFGNFEAEEVLVPSEVNGIIKDIYVVEGDNLRTGDTIARIDTLQLHLKKNQLVAARSAIASGIIQLNSQVKVQEVGLDNLEREQRRFSNLLREGAATEKQIDDLDGQIAISRAQIVTLKSQKLAIEAEMKSQDAQIEQVMDQIRRSFVVAPSDGQVLEKFVEKGEMAVGGRPVIKMAQLTSLILRVYIDGNQLSSIKIGDKVGILFDGAAELKRTEGHVTWISPEAEFTPKIIQTRDERVNLVYAVKILVPNDGRLKIGMPGEIELINK